MCDVPHIHLIWDCWSIDSRFLGFWSFTSSTMILHFFFPQNTIESWFGSNVGSLICKVWHNLTRCFACILRLVTDLNDLMPCLGWKLISRVWMIRIWSTIFIRIGLDFSAFPTIISSLCQPQSFTCLCTGGTVWYGFVDQLYCFFAICGAINRPLAPPDRICFFLQH